MNRARRFGLLLLKLAAFGLICLVLSRHVDLEQMRATLQRVRPDLIAAAFVVLVAQLAVASWRWMLLLRLDGLPARGPRYFVYFGMGNITNLLPGGVIGDVFRVWQVSREGLRIESAANAVILDRLVALATLGALVVVSVLGQALLDGSLREPIRLVALAVGLCILAGIAFVALAEPFLRGLAARRWLSLLHSLSLSTRALLTRSAPGRGKVLLVALGGHLLLIAALLCIARAFDVSLEVGVALVVFPIVLLVSSVPVIPGGWGVREAAMVVALTPFGVAVEAAIGVSVTFGLLALAANLLPALAYLALREPRTG